MITAWHWVAQKTYARDYGLVGENIVYWAGYDPGNSLFNSSVRGARNWMVARYNTDGTDVEQDAETAILLCKAYFQ